MIRSWQAHTLESSPATHALWTQPQPAIKVHTYDMIAREKQGAIDNPHLPVLMAGPGARRSSPISGSVPNKQGSDHHRVSTFHWRKVQMPGDHQCQPYGCPDLAADSRLSLRPVIDHRAAGHSDTGQQRTKACDENQASWGSRVCQRRPVGAPGFSCLPASPALGIQDDATGLGTPGLPGTHRFGLPGFAVRSGIR
jgi:hypothetical protein